jgi:hypothetical protein
MAARVDVEHLQEDSLLRIPGAWGKMERTHIRLTAASEDAPTGALRTAWKLRMDKKLGESLASLQKFDAPGGRGNNLLAGGSQVVQSWVKRKETKGASTPQFPSSVVFEGQILSSKLLNLRKR